jgi:ribosome-binding factor A
MLGSTIQREIAGMIQRDLDDPRVPSIVSVTRVDVAADLSVADIFVSIMGTEGQQTAALNALKHSAGMMRGILTKSLSLRQVPYLKFHLDEKLKKELEMLTLLQKVADENAEADRRRAGGNEKLSQADAEDDGHAAQSATAGEKTTENELN